MAKRFACFAPNVKEMKRRVDDLFENHIYNGEDILLDYLMIYTRGRSEQESKTLHYFREKLIKLIDDGLKYRDNR